MEEEIYEIMEKHVFGGNEEIIGSLYAKFKEKKGILNHMKLAIKNAESSLQGIAPLLEQDIYASLYSKFQRMKLEYTNLGIG